MAARSEVAVRLTLVATVFGLLACSGLSVERTGAERTVERADPPAPSEQVLTAAAPETHPFSGVWESCEGAASPDECSRYVLVQRGERVCGTWSYVATGQRYEGRLIAKAASPTSVVTTQICGRVGAETNAECKDGWQRAAKALNLCSGKLSDIRRADGSCLADYVKVATGAEAEAEADQSWLRACVAQVP